MEDVNSYRPIRLLPIPSKVLEKLILTGLKPIINRDTIIPNQQFGFREQQSTTEQVYSVYNDIAMEKSNIALQHL